MTHDIDKELSERLNRMASVETSRPDRAQVFERARELTRRRWAALSLTALVTCAGVVGLVSARPWEGRSAEKPLVVAGNAGPLMSLDQTISIPAVSDVETDGVSLWAANNGSVKRFTLSGSTLADIRTSGTDYPKLALGEGSVWVADRSGRLLVIDEKTNEVSATVPLPGGATDVAFLAGSVWLSIPSEVKGSVVRVDASSHKVLASIPVGVGPSHVVATAWGIWVLNSQDGTLSLIDPSTNRVVQTTPDLGATSCLIEAEDSLWICANSVAKSALQSPDVSPNAVVRIDEESGEQLARIELDHEGTAAIGFEGSIWVALNRSGEKGAPNGDLVEVNPSSYAVSELSVDVDQTPVALASDGISVWLANFSSGTIQAFR